MTNLVLIETIFHQPCFRLLRASEKLKMGSLRAGVPQGASAPLSIKKSPCLPKYPCPCVLTYPDGITVRSANDKKIQKKRDAASSYHTRLL